MRDIVETKEVNVYRQMNRDDGIGGGETAEGRVLYGHGLAMGAVGLTCLSVLVMRSL